MFLISYEIWVWVAKYAKRYKTIPKIIKMLQLVKICLQF